MARGILFGDLDFDIDAHEIAPGLYQGSYPPEGKRLKELGFAAVVLCAKHLQTPAERFEGVDVIHAPNTDDLWHQPSEKSLQIVKDAAGEVVSRVESGQVVLVTCQAGLNRSGFVTAMALHLMHGWGGDRCVDHVRASRPEALFNEQFVKVLRQLPERKDRRGLREK